MTLKIKLVLLLILCLGLSACAINTPLSLQDLQGELKGNQLFIGKSFTLDAGNKINGDIVGIGTNLTLEPGSVVEGNILLIGSSLEMGGIVKGDLNLFAGNSRLMKTAILNGDINQIFHHVILDHNAQVTGEMNSFTFPGFPSEQISGFISTITDWFKPDRWLIWDLTRILVISLLTLLAIILLKRNTLRISAQVQAQPLIAWGVGIFVALVAPFLALILIITICLLPIGLLLLLALALSCLFGWLALGIVLGRLVNRWLQTHWSDELQAFLGALILGAITSIIGWIPCIGWIFNLMLGSIGLGAVVITRFGVLIPQENPTSVPLIPKNTPPQPPKNKPSAEKSKKIGTKTKK